MLVEILGDVEEAAVVIEFMGLVTDELAAGKFSPVGLVVAEDPVARGAFFSLKLGEEADAIGGIVFS